MKSLMTSIWLMVILAMVTACTTSQSGTSSRNSDPSYANFYSLADVLRAEPGLQVLGTGDNVKILIRGISTIKLDTQPLYVINGMPIGTNYVMANNAINVREIISIRVLRGASQTTLYGGAGVNGVIEIKTKVAN